MHGGRIHHPGLLFNVVVVDVYSVDTRSRSQPHPPFLLAVLAYSELSASLFSIYIAEPHSSRGVSSLILFYGYALLQHRHGRVLLYCHVFGTLTACFQNSPKKYTTRSITIDHLKETTKK